MDIPDEGDGFKWFGEGFDGFPKRLPEDCAEYVIHIVNDKLETAAAVRERLGQVLKTSTDLFRKLLKDYIWQRDAFELKLQPSPGTKISKDAVASPHLYGRTNFGDSVADEWLVVYLLLELSRKFSDAWIRVYDTDGEFLLIEAANALPKWLNPDMAENRVWISNGHLRIIPLDGDSPSRNLSVQDALHFIQRQPEKLIMSPFIEDEAFYRLRDYPSAISTSLHHALTTIPRTLAYILHRNPAYISQAIEAFYLRDPISMRPLSTKDISTLHFPPEDFVTVSVKFTKVGYAQLRGQVFDPPPAWTGMIPRMTDPKAEIGMKLTCGFEMLLSDAQNRDKRTVREIKLLLEDIKTGEDTLPSDTELSTWPQIQDDEKWLDIDFNDFEDVLSGKQARGHSSGSGFGDARAQENLSKMVSRFEEFLDDDTAGAEGVGDIDDEGTDSESGTNDEQESDVNEDDFSRAMEEVKQMHDDDITKNGLLDEARKLALADAEDQSDVDEDEEMKKVMEIMEQELKRHGALSLSDARVPKPDKAPRTKAVFGPERPPQMQDSAKQSLHALAKSGDAKNEQDNSELSSDDEEFNDVDLGLAKNMLESFKGQAGLAGPAGNLMRAMGVHMPRDEANEDE